MSATLINDREERVPALGEAGSIERARCEWPVMIARLEELRTTGKMTRYRATRLMSSRGVVMLTERVTILQAAGFTQVEAMSLCGWSPVGMAE